MKFSRKGLADLLAIVFFVIISFMYFVPAVPEGRILFQHDAQAGAGASQELIEYRARTGERTRWTNALFGGMPTYQISPSYDTSDLFYKAVGIYHLYLPDYVWYVFAYLLGFYILLRAFDFRQWMAALGAIAWAFSSYFFIIIAAGHLWKVMTLAYIPPTIAAMVMIMRGKYLKGGVLMALFVAMQIKANHIQMSYYFAFVMLFMLIAFAYQKIRQGEWRHVLRSVAIMAAAGIIGVGVNLSNLYHVFEYTQESMRGGSSLADDSHKSGLDSDYMTQWSYGIGETWSLLVPNIKGGASQPLSQSEVAMEKANPQLASLYGQVSQYWGEQPGTAGPVYAGAIVMALFLLGALIVKGPLKWALLAATLLSFFFAWGKNTMWFTDLCIAVLPIYTKFRAVSSALVIAEFTIPLLAMLGLKKLIDEPTQGNMKALLASFGLAAAACLVFALAPDTVFGNLISSGEMKAFGQFDTQTQAMVISSLDEMRSAILSHDAFRSLAFILAALAMIILYFRKTIKEPVLAVALTALCLLDMWTVNKRYLYDDMFIDKSVKEASLKKTPADEYILKDTTKDFRVLNFAGDTFGENRTSYYHKSVGGYHAAKLSRYDDMINAYIRPEMSSLGQAVVDAGGDMAQVPDTLAPVINMLNTRYLLLPSKQGDVPILNPYAFGNLWKVTDIRWTSSPKEEISALKDVDLSSVAVIDESFKQSVGQTSARDSSDTMALASYEPNCLKYDISQKEAGLIVFSEVYYPGWEAFIDGSKAELARANFVLRALSVPAGHHKVELVFRPSSVKATETVAWICLALLAIGLIVLAGRSIAGMRKHLS